RLLAACHQLVRLVPVALCSLPQPFLSASTVLTSLPEDLPAHKRCIHSLRSLLTTLFCVAWNRRNIVSRHRSSSTTLRFATEFLRICRPLLIDGSPAIFLY